MKKTLTALLAALLVAGCSSGGPAASTPAGTAAGTAASTPAAATGSISVMASQDWVKDPELALAKKFEESTGIKVDYQIVPADQYPALLTTKLNSGEAADIFMNQSGKFDIVSQLQIEKNGTDLTDQAWVSTFDAAVKDQVSANGKVYGITIWDQSDSYAYIYNKLIFAELNLTPPTNFAEFKAVSEAIKKADITPIYEPVKDGWHHQLNFFDVSAAYDKSDANLVANLNANKATFAETPIFKQMIEQMKEVYDAGYWGEDAFSNEYANLAAEMATGDYAMTTNMMGRIADIVAAGKKYTEDDFGIFPAPYLDNQIIAETPCGPSKFIYSGSKNTDAAKKYLAFLAEPANLQYMIDEEPSFNALPFSGLKTTYPAAMEAAIKAFKPGTSTVYQNAVVYLNPQWMDFGSDLAAYLTGDMDADEVIANIDERRADQAAAAKDANW
ncbi:MAG TPA: ABC transporter substrate-binding protein [Propionicimonas sp.]|nr:ABC transporter substrate-binding protein [Propionicimonas sp.]HRA05679.1 ABC transporter substrate-binding protein [Propionicimonas sp.]